MTTPDKIISQFTSSHTKWRLLYEMSVQQFYKLEWPTVPKRENHDWFIFKLEQPNSTSITINSEPVNLFYGKMHFIQEKDKNIGFMINTPQLEHRFYQDTLISAPKSTNVDELEDEAQVFLTTDKFSIFTLADTVQYVAVYNKSFQQAFN